MAEQRAEFGHLAVIVPVLDEIGEVTAWLRHIGLMLPGAVVVVSDGGSTDGTVEAVTALQKNPRLRRLDGSLSSLRLIVEHAPRGRGTQLRRGARAALDRASPAHLLFLHVDTALTGGAQKAIREALADPGFRWGWFDVRLDGPSWSERVIEWGISRRARITGRPTGDQGLLITAEQYLAVGGYEAIPLFEDVDLAARLRRQVRGRALGAHVVTSGRRYREWGHWRTVLRMWGMRVRFWLGARPEQIHRHYGRRGEK